MFNRQRRRRDRETRLFQVTLNKLASQPPTSVAIAHLEETISTLLQRSESAQAARDSIVVHLWRKVIDQDHDVNKAVRQLVSLCVSMSERLEMQHREQQELLEVVRVLGQNLELQSNPAPAQLKDADVIDVTENRDVWHASR